MCGAGAGAGERDGSRGKHCILQTDVGGLPAHNLVLEILRETGFRLAL